MNKTKQKIPYTPPRVVRSLSLEMEQAILGGSVVDKIEGVHAVPQDVQTYDFSDTQFNHHWEGGDQ